MREAIETVCDPTWTGMGPFEREVPDGLWIEAAVAAMKKTGPEKFLRKMLTSLRTSLDAAYETTIDDDQEETVDARHAEND